MTDRRPLAAEAPDLLQDLAITLGRLLRGEIALARAEMARAARVALAGAAMLLAAVVLALTALHLFAGAGVVAFVRAGLSPLQATLAMGAILLALAVALAFAGLGRLRPETMVPRRALSGLRRDAAALKSEVTTDAA